jgi:galactonate dehydratase
VKITNIETFAVFNGARNNLFVTVDTDAGVDGVGESGLSGRELAVIGAIEHFKPLLIGQDATRIEHIWQTLFRGGFFPANRVIGSAISAIDIALWDIAGKALNVPIYRLLGGLARDRVVCYPHAQSADGGPDPVGALVTSCQQHVAEGWKFLRWHLPPQPGDVLEPRLAIRAALEQMEAVRGAVGDDIELCMDIHTRLDLPDAVRLCRESERFRPLFSWRTRCARKTRTCTAACASKRQCPSPRASSSPASGSSAS